MSQRNKVVWFEGMNLDPHHFQHWDRFYKSTLDFRIRSISTCDWGLLEITIDKDALLNGQFKLLLCKGVTPDGLIFDIPADDPVPNSRSIQEFFPATENELSVFLAIPVERERGSNCRLEGELEKKSTRYIFNNISVTDDNTGADERQIGVGRTNFQLRFGNESLEDFSVLKIAEIIRSTDGSFTLSDKFIPACLAIEASENLMTITRRLLELLTAKSTSLSATKNFSGKVDFSTQDITIFQALQILNANIPLVNHFYCNLKSHPEQLYLRLLSLGGLLSTFSQEADMHPRHFPNYDHSNLSGCFNQMDAKIRALLDTIAPSAAYISIPLEKKSESLFIGNISDKNLFQKAKFYLIVSGDMPDRKMIDEIPTNFRVASPEIMNAVLSSFRTALTLKHTSVPPAGLTPQEGKHYFWLDPSGPFWDQICQSSSFAIFVPTELSHLNIEAIAV